MMLLPGTANHATSMTLTQAYLPRAKGLTHRASVNGEAGFDCLCRVGWVGWHRGPEATVGLLGSNPMNKVAHVIQVLVVVCCDVQYILHMCAPHCSVTKYSQNPFYPLESSKMLKVRP